MQESTFFQYHLEKATERLTQEALEQGIKKGAIEVILAFLAARFQPGAVSALKPLLETIDDLDHLKQLGSAAAQVQSLEAFLQTLGAQENSQNGTDTI